MKVSCLISIVIVLVLAFIPLVPVVDTARVLGAPSSTVEVETDNVLELGDSEEVIVTFKNSASADVNDLASTFQFVTLAAANLNPTRAIIALDASWEIYVSEAAATPRVTGSVTGAVDTTAIYAPYSTIDTVYLYTWALGKPDGTSSLSAYTNSTQFANDLRILRPGEVLKLKVSVECQNVVGDSRLWFFLRATEFEPASIPVANITAIPEAQRINIYYSKSPGPDKTPYWWPLHNSYDPYDSDIKTGHVFDQVSWTRSPTTTAFSKSNKLVHQKPQENPGVPCIDITKTGAVEALRGENITYELTVSNCGAVGLTNVTVNDTLLGLYDIPDLAVGASYTFNATYEVGNDAPDPLVNIATASGWYNTTQVTDPDSHSVDIVEVANPCINITKTGPAEALKGENITYEFTVSNCGNVGLTNVTVNDTPLGSYNIPDLAVGASYTFNATYTVPGGAPDTLVNNATASGWHNITQVTDPDNHSVDIVEKDNPCIDITKTGPAEAKKGENITYEFTVSNCGNVGLTNVTVTDTLTGSRNISDLPVGASQTFTDTYTIPLNAPDTLVNNATASGWHNITQVTDPDNHPVITKRSFSFHICGIKFRDLDADGRYEVETEPGIDAVTIILLGADNATPAEKYYPELKYPGPEENPLLSGENMLKGSYCFNIYNETDGKEYTFYVREEVPPGMVATTPTWVGPITLVASTAGPRESLNNHFGNARMPPPVGGDAYPVSRISVLAPWIVVGVILAVGIGWYILKRRRAQN
jgi:uncharacterized repeat protein (TIGR01451 family)